MRFWSIYFAPTLRSLIQIILTSSRISVLSGLFNLKFNSTVLSLEILCGLRLENRIPVADISSMSISPFSAFSLIRYSPASRNFFSVSLPKFQAEPKTLSTWAFSLHPFMSILKIRYIYIFLGSTCWTNYRYLIGIIYINCLNVFIFHFFDCRLF